MVSGTENISYFVCDVSVYRCSSLSHYAWAYIYLYTCGLRVQDVMVAGGMESMSNAPFYLARGQPSYGGATIKVQFGFC